MIFQQDGAPPHWRLDVRKFLDDTFPYRWIGRGGPTPWPPRSPNITPLDFFLWGYVKDRVYATQVPNLEMLTTKMLQNTWRKLDFHLDSQRVTMGAHVELC